MMRFMLYRGFLAIIALTVLAGSRRAEATLINVHMGGTVNNVDASENDALAGVFNVGDHIDVNYTFDTDVAARDGSNASFAVFDSLTAFSLSIGSYTATSSGASEIQIDNHLEGAPTGVPDQPDTDRYAVVVSRGTGENPGLNGADIGNYFLSSFFARFDDATGALFDTALTQPTQLTFDQFTSSQFFLNFDLINPADPSITGVFTTLDFPVSAVDPIVPEPATLLLTATGLALGGAIRRRTARV